MKERRSVNHSISKPFQFIINTKFLGNQYFISGDLCVGGFNFWFGVTVMPQTFGAIERELP